MLSLLSDKFNIHRTHQREIKSNNKRNSTISNSVKKDLDIAVTCFIDIILVASSHTGLGLLKSGIKILTESDVVTSNIRKKL